jgi:hypothetical protein
MNQNISNPYQSPLPVSHIENLYGRQSVLQEIINRLSSNSQFFEVIGSSRIGKTSLLNVIEDLNNENIDYASLLSFDPGFQRKLIFISVNFEGLNYGELTNFWGLIGKSIYKSIESLGINIPGMNGRNTSSFSEFEEDLEKIVSKLSLYNFRIVFLFDEFDIVARFIPQQILSNLRFTLQHFEPNIVFITGSQRTLYDYHLKRPIDERPSSPLHSYLDPQGTLYLGLLDKTGDKHDVISFITEPARKNGVEFTEEEIAFTLEVGGRHPDLTRITCYYLFEGKKNNKDEVLDYSQILHSIRKMTQPVCDAIWSNLSESEQSLFLDLASSSLSDQENTILENDKSYQEMGLVIKYESGFQVPSRIFAEYIREIGKLPSLPEMEYPANIIKSRNLKIWDGHNVVQIDGKLHHLRPKEMQILIYLVNNANRVCTPDDLSRFAEVPESSLQSTISRLRRAIEQDPNQPPLIRTIYGEGYLFEQV